MPLNLREIERLYLAERRAVPSSILQELARDSRVRAGEILRSIQKDKKALAEERRRICRLQKLERDLRTQKGYGAIAGIDEVGVGPIAGPVVAAAVILPADTMIPGVDDSKKVAEKKRRELAARIEEIAIGVGIGVASVEEIDDLNIYQAGLLSMKRAVEALPQEPDFLLVDARRIPSTSIPQLAVTAGDRKHYSIGAASILAKVRRDDIMEELDKSHPFYGFSQHKGYCTQLHREAIQTHGPCEAHRLSYSAVQELALPYSENLTRHLCRIRETRTVDQVNQILEPAHLGRLPLREWEMALVRLQGRKKIASLQQDRQLSLF